MLVCSGVWKPDVDVKMSSSVTLLYLFFESIYPLFLSVCICVCV